MIYIAMAGTIQVSRGNGDVQVLYDAIYHASRHGEDVRVVTGNGEEVWFVEADTKVDDADQTFPVIVHDRSV